MGSDALMCSTYYNIEWQPTIRNGVQYRSALEARWSYLFDLLRIPNVYEPKQFYIPELAGTPEEWYTVDFGLLTCPFHYIEIKPKYPPESAIIKCASLSSQKNFRVAIFYGSCWWSQFDVMIFQQGQRREIPASLIQKIWYTWKLSEIEAREVIGLKYVLGNRDYVSAFKEVMKWK